MSNVRYELERLDKQISECYREMFETDDTDLIETLKEEIDSLNQIKEDIIDNYIDDCMNN